MDTFNYTTGDLIVEIQVTSYNRESAVVHLSVEACHPGDLEFEFQVTELIESDGGLITRAEVQEQLQEDWMEVLEAYEESLEY